MLDRRTLLASAAALAGTAAAARNAAPSKATASNAAAMKHVVLLGDSVFDNAAYVGGGPDVVTQLRAALPHGWRATLAAVDGAVIANVGSQLAGVPTDASHLIVSIGGNDALHEAGVLEAGACSVADALDQLAAIRERFAHDFAAMLDLVAAQTLPTAVCTIYDARFPEAHLRRLAATALTAINDCITREAFSRGLALVDLRLICASDTDFANPIEPSVHGGKKIARAIARFATEAAPSSAVFADGTQ